jgi:chaperonin GroEL
MAKKVISNEKAREKLFQGCEVVYKAVSSTLGPKGQNVALERYYGKPQVVHDGVTVAKEIELEDPNQNVGASLIIEAAEKTNDKAGDGTTTAILLAYEIIKVGLRQIANGENAQIFKEEIKVASEKVIEYLRDLAKEIKSNEEIANIANIASADPKIGKMVAAAYEKVGKDGVVTHDIGHAVDIEVEYKEGMVVPNGYIVPHFITDVQTLTAELKSPRVLVTDQDISSINDILGVLKEVTEKDGKEIFIIASGVSGSALATLLQNKQLGNLKPLAIKAPRGGDLQQGMLEDIAIVTGAMMLSEKIGRPISSITIDDLGRAGKVVADRNETLITDGGGDKKQIKARIAELKKRIEDADSDF